MSDNSPKHFTIGIGVYTPWRAVDEHVKESLTKQAPPRSCEWKRGVWKDGELIEGVPKQADNRRVHVQRPGRGDRKHWSRRPHGMSEVYFSSSKGWQLRIKT